VEISLGAIALYRNPDYKKGIKNDEIHVASSLGRGSSSLQWKKQVIHNNELNTFVLGMINGGPKSSIGI
jgi:hypothetical protein